MKNAEHDTVHKTQNRPLGDFSPAPPYFVIPFRAETLPPLMRYLKTVVIEFFIHQFAVKFGLRNTPVVQVDHELDRLIPFVPEKITVYLDFVNFWIRPITFILKRFGGKTALNYCAGYLDMINKTYSQAARVYRFRMSTTNRPPAPLFGKFRTIHILDPHLLCVPSLHVSIVILAYVFFPDVFSREQLPQEEQERRKQELYRGAVQITESVLYVKQHSVNCIPAALYMMVSITDGLFAPAQAEQFIEELFKTAKDISGTEKTLIRNHIAAVFRWLIKESENKTDWAEPLRQWLQTYN